METVNQTNGCSDSPNNDSYIANQQPDDALIPTKAKFYQNINFIMFLVCMYNIGQCMVATGQLMVTIPLLEKIFGFQSYQMSFPNICYNASFGICSMLIGNKKVGRKILAIGVGGVIVASGCFLFITPHFISSYKQTDGNIDGTSSEYGMKQFHLCKWKDNDDSSSTSTDSSSTTDSKLFNWKYNRADLCLVMFCAAFCIIGIGSTPLHTFIITYLNEATSSGQAGMYLAIFYISGAIGPAIGFILGKPFLSIRVNWPSKLENTEITPQSENWIGAWWMGFCFGGIVILFFSILIICVGLKNKPSNKQNSSLSKCCVRRHNVIENGDNRIQTYNLSPKNLTIKRKYSFFAKVASMFSNYHLMLIYIGLSFDMLPLTAFTSFLTKIITLQFRVNVNASLITGAVVIPAACVGFALGSVFNKFVVTNYHKMIGLCVISYLTIFFVGGMFVSCPTRDVSGIVLNSDKIATEIFYTDCNKLCNCEHRRYEPVCYNMTTYFNPCVFGCTESAVSDSIGNFINCKCMSDTGSEVMPVTDGGCVDWSCHNIYIYLGSVAITLILVLCLGIPFILYTLSATKDHLKDFSIGFFQTLVRFFVICGPMLYGYLIDKSCILWMPDKYRDKRGYCAEYNNEELNNMVGTAIIVSKFLASVCYTVSLILYLKKRQ